MQEMPQESNEPLQSNVTPEATPKSRPVAKNFTIILAVAVLVVGIIICLSIFALINSSGASTNHGSQTTATSTPQSSNNQTAAPPDSQTPVAPSVPEITVTPAATPPVTPEKAVPVQSATPTASSVGSDTIITRQAYQVVLNLNDMGKGWTFSSAAASYKKFVASSSHINFTKGTSFAPVVQNLVYVFRSIDAAKSVYEDERLINLSNAELSSPAIGDECFLNENDLRNKVLVFRENNVVVWIYLQQWEDGDPVEYAKIVNQKITQ